jgi:hypothetical protein
MGVQVLQRMRSAKWGKSLALAATAVALAGCSKQEGAPPAPVDCKQGADAVEAALTRAPARVEVGGTTLSECFTRGSNSADLQLVGASYVTVATRLAAAAKERPDGPEALRLGYLVGAARRGTTETQGIHEELMRRIEQELIGVDTRTAAYRRGFEAGRARG